MKMRNYMKKKNESVEFETPREEVLAPRELLCVANRSRAVLCSGIVFLSLSLLGFKLLRFANIVKICK